MVFLRLVLLHHERVLAVCQKSHRTCNSSSDFHLFFGDLVELTPVFAGTM